MGQQSNTVQLLEGEEPLNAARRMAKFERAFDLDEVIFRQGDNGNSMFVVVEGAVRIEYERQSEQRSIVAIRTVGEFFGEMALVDAGRRTAFAIAATSPTRLIEIDRARFMYLVSQQPAFSLTVMRALCRRIPMSTSEAGVDP